MDGIPDGEYEVFFTGGADWDGAGFTRSCSFDRFDDIAMFATTETGEGIEYTTYSMTLHPIQDGNVTITPVSPGSFPK